MDSPLTHNFPWVTRVLLCNF